MGSSSSKTERTFIRLLLGLFGAIVLTVLVSWGGCQAYNRAQEGRLIRRAAAYMAGGDLKTAALSARRAVQINEHSPEAARMMAEIAERSGDRAALEWRRKVVQLKPESKADALALVTSALQFKEIKIAEIALGKIDEAGRQTAGYYAATARLAEGKGKAAEARDSWERALQLAPDNKSFQFQLALSRLALPMAEERATALASLRTLRADKEQRAVATRALILDAATHNENTAEVRALAHELQTFPEATFRDRILFLELLRRLNDPQFASHLTETEKVATEDAANLGMLLAWMNGSGMSLVAIDFAKTLPVETTSKWPVPFQLATAHARLADWPAVERLTRDFNWGRYDFMRRAFLTRALRSTDQLAAAEREWAAATKEASAQGETLLSLARTIAEWGWSEEIVELIWALTKFPGKREEALASLYNHYAKTSDTQGLYRVFLRMAEADPDDLDVQNNLAQTSLLLGAEPERARKLAAETHRKNPTNPSYTSTYAFSLFSQGDPASALQALNALSEEQLRVPAVSAYYGIFLAATGDAEKARRFLDLGEKASLLPEERALIEQARNRLQHR